MLEAYVFVSSGLFSQDAILTMVRVMVGLFFWTSGSWKSFREESHANILHEMKARHIPFPRFQTWFVSSVELFGGMALIVGMLTAIAAVGLAIICIVACATDKRPTGSLWDIIGDLLWKQDILLAMLLVIIAAAGSGPYSADHVVTLAMAAR